MERRGEKIREMRDKREERRVCPMCQVDVTSTFNDHFNTV